MEIKSQPMHDPSLIPIAEKVYNGERLTFEDGLKLFQSNDIIGLGKLAHFVQTQKNGDAVYFVINQKIEPTNICVLSCKFCDFAVPQNSPDAYEMTIDEIVKRLNKEIQEVHITGGLHPEWTWDYYLNMLRQIRYHFPSINIKAFTAVEIDYFHRKFKMPVEEILLQLKEAGLQALPGGGAEVFSERVRKYLFHQKIGADRWLEIHRIAHKLGIPSNATLLYGHIETIEERITHLIRLRELQDETKGFLSFIPLAFQPGTTGIKPPDRYTSAIDDLKLIAISRLMLDNIPHIKAYWVMSTEEVAAAALNFGADDLDGTVGGERIAHDAGAKSPAHLTKERLIAIIREAKKIPVERDVFYTPLNVHSSKVIGKIPYLNSTPFFTCINNSTLNFLPITPRRMGLLAEKGQLLAGLFSLADYLRLRSQLQPLPYCIATSDQVKSVLLFSNDEWKNLEGKIIGVTDATATSIILLKILLHLKYGVKANFRRMNPVVNNVSEYDAVLLIGDEALQHLKHRLEGFKLIFDLAKEWSEWKHLPFVFAIWALNNTASAEEKEEVMKFLDSSLNISESKYQCICAFFSKSLNIPVSDCIEYLQGFNFRLGEKEKLAIQEFEVLAEQVLKTKQKEEHYG